VDYLTRYKEILDEEGMTGKEVCDLLGMSYGGYRVATRSGADVCPLWVRMFVMGYMLSEKKANAKALFHG